MKHSKTKSSSSYERPSPARDADTLDAISRDAKPPNLQLLVFPEEGRQDAAFQTSVTAEEIAVRPRNTRENPTRKVAIVCKEHPQSPLGHWVASEAREMVAQGMNVRLYCALAFDDLSDAVTVQAVGVDPSINPVAQATDFGQRVAAAFEQDCKHDSSTWAVLAHEWSCVPALVALRTLGTRTHALSLHSVERQRSDMSEPISESIEQIEILGVERADVVMLHDPYTRSFLSNASEDQEDKLVLIRPPFPIEEFQSSLDPGRVKARFQVGPVDPTLLFIGDADRAHGPDILMKAFPAIRKVYPQARAVFVGEGPMLWPLRVQSRYMLQDHAVRIVGHLEGQALRDLIAASDVIVVPSRERTENWQILAGWAARKPVVATHEVATGLGIHERNSILIFPHESSCVWGIGRVLGDAQLATKVGYEGHRDLEHHYGWAGVVTQIRNVFDETAD